MASATLLSEAAPPATPALTVAEVATTAMSVAPVPVKMGVEEALLTEVISDWAIVASVAR